MNLTPNFYLEEFACHDGTPVPPKYIDNVRALAVHLQALRDYLGEPVHINSAYRTAAHNKRIGGEPNSQHLLAKAADITVKSKSPKQLATIIELLIANGKMKQGGLGIYAGFVHTDIRGAKARWRG